jgi:hypothetical protein
MVLSKKIEIFSIEIFGFYGRYLIPFGTNQAVVLLETGENFRNVINGNGKLSILPFGKSIISEFMQPDFGETAKNMFPFDNFTHR